MDTIHDILQKNHMVADGLHSMELDGADRGILSLLQCDARHLTTREMGDRVGGLCEDGAGPHREARRGGGHPGVPSRRRLRPCRVPALRRTYLSRPEPRTRAGRDRGLGVEGVVAVREVPDGTANVQVDAVGANAADVPTFIDVPCEVGLDVVTAKLGNDTSVQPIHQFGAQLAEDGDD